MTSYIKSDAKISKTTLLTFISITLFYFFESVQMSYFNVLAPYFLSQSIYNPEQIGSLSAAYYYGDMVGLIPVGLSLDRFPLRRLLLWAIFGSVLCAFLLLFSQDFYFQWLARFLCGLLGGTFSFVGGIRILANLYPQRFTLFIGLFLSAGMFAGLICQYPLLIIVNNFGIQAVMGIVAFFGLVVMAINFFYLHPIKTETLKKLDNSVANIKKAYFDIFKNLRNWLDCLMVVLLDTPISIIGTLWGIVILINYYNFPDATSAWIVMVMFAGLIVGSPIWGLIADRFHHSAWIIFIGSNMSLLMVILMLALPHSSNFLVACFFFNLGFFSSCQTLGFTWITKNMRPELIGINSSFNSIFFMGANGLLKQIAAYLLSSTVLIKTISGSANILLFIAFSMAFSAMYALMRHRLFKKPLLDLDMQQC